MSGPRPVLTVPSASVENPCRDRVAWCDCAGRLVFLDVARDRYFQLSSDGEAAFRADLERERLGTFHQPAYLPRPDPWMPPVRAHPALDETTFRLTDVAAALWTQRRVEKRLMTTGFDEVLSNLAALQDRSMAAGADAACVRDTVQAFERARLLRTAADRCLPRSIALALRLARHGVTAHVAIGVRTNPFGAHCWAQLGEVVLNDSVEEVRRYTPILIL